MSKFLFFWRRKNRFKVKHISKFINVTMHGRLIKLLSFLLIVIILHSVAITHFEKLSFEDALWLSFTSITTVGYGDFSASTTAGRITTIVLMYIIGIWLLAQLAGDFLDFRAEKREKMIRGLWRWKDMSDHILIINTPSAEGDRYLIRLVEQIKQTPELENLPIEIATTAYPDGLPNELRRHNVVHYHIDVSSTIHLEDLNIEDAKFIIVLSQDEADVRSDSLTLDMLDRIRQYDYDPYVIAECILDENRSRFHRLGANAVIRPVRGYPELIVRALSAPGTERVLENLFTHDGASAKRYNIEITKIKWKDIACQLISQGVGTPIGYIDNDNEVITNPLSEQEISAQALLIIVNHESKWTHDQIRNIISC